MYHVIENVSYFAHDSNCEVTFHTWHKRYGDIFTVELALHDGATEFRLLFRKLGPAQHVRHSVFIISYEGRACSFPDTVGTLNNCWGDLTHFHSRIHNVQAAKQDTNGVSQYAGSVYRERTWSQLDYPTEVQGICLIFICGPQSLPSFDP